MTLRLDQEAERLSGGIAIPGQRTIWDELVEQQVEAAPSARRFVAGVLSHIALLDDDRLIKVGLVARREATTAAQRGRHPSAATWQALLGACTDEWLRRHPRP
jgi:hypothetical protein